MSYIRWKKGNISLGKTQSCVFTCTSTLICYDRTHRCWSDLCFPARFKSGMSNNKHVLDGYGYFASLHGYRSEKILDGSSLGPRVVNFWVSLGAGLNFWTPEDLYWGNVSALPSVTPLSFNLECLKIRILCKSSIFPSVLSYKN